MNEHSVKHRGWVKNAAIIFLAIMLVLTFFSNTILNYSLPEVAAQYVQSGTITSKVRASAPVEANMTFNVEMAETRKIDSVRVKVGDLVEAGDILVYLADEESQELKSAQIELAALELAYEKALLQLEDPSYAADNQQIKELKEDIAAKKEERSTVANKEAAVASAKAAVRNAEDIVDAISEQKAEIEEKIAELSGDSSVLAQFKEALTDAQKQLSAAQENLAELQGKGGNLESAEAARDAASQNLQDQNNTLTHLLQDRNMALTQLDNMLLAAKNSMSVSPADNEKPAASTTPSITQIEYARAETALANFKKHIEDNTTSSDSYFAAQNELELAFDALNQGPVPDFVSLNRNIERQMLSVQRAQEDLTKAEEDYSKTKSMDSLISQAQSGVDYWKQQVDYAQRSYDTALANTTSTLKTQLDDINERLKAANRNLEDANEALSKAQSESSTSVEAIDEELKNLQRQLESLYISLGEKTDSNEVSQALANLDLEAQRKTIDDKKAEIEKLSAQGTGATVNAQYAGMVSSIGCVAGDTVSTGSIVAVIEVVEKGYRMEFPVTNEQARLIKVGDKAKINDWWYSEADITVTAIRNDPKNPGQGKIVVCTLAGDVTVGQTLSIELGERGTNYDIVVPNSAIREDSNGKFLLVVEARATPLSTRYIATRCDITVVAADDNNSAVSGALYGNEFIITTSTKPIVVGQQVRLVEN